MSRTIFTLVGRIRTEGLDSLQKGLTKIDKQLAKSANKIDKFGRNVQRVGKGLIKLTAPIGVIGAAAVKFGADFEKAMTNSLAIMGDVSDGMKKKLEDGAKAVAATTDFSAKQAAEAYFFLASAGLTAAESLEAMPRVAAFAQAGMFDLATATDLLTDAQSALGLSADDAAQNMANMSRVSDVLVKANTLANATVQQFSEALTNKAGAALRLLDKDLEEGAAILAVYADQGVKGAEAGTQLNIVLRDLQTASIKNRAAFENAGVAVFDAQGEMRNMADIVADLEVRLAGMSDEERRAELMHLGFTSKSLAATAALIGTSGAIRDYEAKLRKAAGTTDEIAKKQLANFWAQLGLVKDRLINVGITLYTTLQPALLKATGALGKLVGWLQSAVDKFNSLSPFVKDIIIAFATFAVTIGPVLLAVGKLISLVKTAQLVFTSLNAIMVANPIGLIVTGIGLLVAAGWVLVRNWDSISGFFKKIWGEMGHVADQIVSAVIVSMARLAADTIGALEKVAKYVPGLGDKFKKLRLELDAFAATKEKDYLARVLEHDRLKLAAADLAQVEEVVKAVKKSEDEETEAVKKNAAARKISTKAVEDQRAAELALMNARGDFEAEWTDKIIGATLTREEALNLEHQNALAEAKRLGVDTFKIDQFYAIKRKELKAEEAEAKQAQTAKELEEEKAIQQQRLDMTVGAINTIFSLFQQSTDNKIQMIEQQLDAEKNAIDASMMSEEQKTAKKAELDEIADRKKKKLMIKQAKRDKAAAIFAAVISTFQAIAKALTLGIPGIALAAVMGVLGGIQIGLIAAQPLPQLADGGVVPKRRGGVDVTVAEGNDAEMIMPLSVGIRSIVDGVLAGLSSVFNAPALPATLAGGGSPMPAGAYSVGGGGGLTLQIGTFIGNKSGILELARKLGPVIKQEQQRKGEL